MDITFRTDEGVFNLRVAAVIIDKGRLLIMRDDTAPHYYLPGGRVKLHEPAQAAILRELEEELGVKADIIRPLWLAEGFFELDCTGEKFHELCLYYLADVSHTELTARGDTFERRDGRKMLSFEWTEFSSLKDLYFYPEFLKTEIFSLPDSMKIISFSENKQTALYFSKKP